MKTSLVKIEYCIKKTDKSNNPNINKFVKVK